MRPSVPRADPRPGRRSSPLDATPTRPRRREWAGAPTFRIGTAMVLIAVVAVCLGAFASGVMEGTLVTIGILAGDDPDASRRGPEGGRGAADVLRREGR